jgi:hypothetical protein
MVYHSSHVWGKLRCDGGEQGLVQREPGIYYGRINPERKGALRVQGRPVEGAITGPDAPPIELDRVVALSPLDETQEGTE